MQRIRAGVRQMGELTDGLLSLARVSRTQLKNETTDLGTLAIDALQACREQDAGRVVTANVQPCLIAMGDRALLKQVMENLIANAWKFTAHTSEAEICVGRLTNEDALTATTFYVRDNGAGFDRAYVEKLFGTFQRLHSPGAFSGTGIGLATTHRIVSRHGGRIWAQAVVGNGATFFYPARRGHSRAVAYCGAAGTTVSFWRSTPPPATLPSSPAWDSTRARQAAKASLSLNTSQRRMALAV